MPEVVWYRSLYWRIASGFVALLATLLVAQGLVFLWMTGRMTDVFPTRSPAQFATSLASDVGAVLIDQPGVDLHAYINSNYNSSYRGYVVVLADGRSFTSDRVPPPPSLARSARFRLHADRGDPMPSPDGLRSGRGRGGPGSSGRSVWGMRDGGPDGGRSGGVEYARVLDAGTVVGIVAVPRELPPMSVAMRDLGPTLAAVALGLLAAGTAVSALVIFRPTRRRLSQLQDAARAIGAGAVGVRAPDQGGDEVTSLSRAFNDMAVQLEQRTNALDAADRTRRQLLADVSHELMTPLSAIRGYVETLQMADLRLDEGTRTRYLGIVNDESERLEEIIGDLLELARLEGGGGALRNDTVSVAQLLERVRHRHEPILDDKRITLDAVEDPAVGVFRGDQYRLEQALQNLVANAIRHTPDGGRVSVRAAREGNELILSVEDTGVGIPEEHLARVFDRFYKIDESRTGTKLQSGSGLGLSIVQAIVARHGGTVSASSVPGAGARFEIRLPGAHADEAAFG